jgi:transcriptional regulator with XRE-family HTH domain
MTQSQLAEAIGRSPDLVSRIERGDTAPSFETLEKLSLALGTHPGALFGAESPQSGAPPSARDAVLDGLSPRELQWLADLLKVIRARPG